MSGPNPATPNFSRIPDLAEVAMEGGASGCNKCHNGIRAMIYLNDPVPPYEDGFDFAVAPDDSMNIACTVCHDVHGNDNKANLRRRRQRRRPS